MKYLLILIFLPLSLFASLEIFNQVEKVNIGINEYRLGKILTDAQKLIATKNALQSNSEDTYKFNDNDTYIIVDKKSNRVVVIYQAYNNLNAKNLKRVVGRHIGEYEEPTTVTHGNIIYWFYKNDGTKLTIDEYEQWRSKIDPNNKNSVKKIDKLLTVKLSTNKSIDSKEDFSDGTAYLIISSETLLKSLY